MVFPVEYNGRIYRVAMPSLVKNRISLLEMTPEEEADRVIRVLRSIRAYAKIDESPDDDETIMNVFRRANENNLLPNFMKNYKTLPSRTTPRAQPITQPIIIERPASEQLPVQTRYPSKIARLDNQRLESDNDSVFI